MSDTLRIHEQDNVEVLLREVDGIPRGHKRALKDIAKGEDIIKYGHPIGHATRDIRCGEHVHTHNVKTNLSGELSYTYNPVEIPALPQLSGTFEGYVRADGSVGIRNELWIVPTVGCANKIAERLAHQMNARLGQDQVFAFPHPYGCSQMGDDQAHTQRTLKGLVNHPNAAGVLVLGLGCENNHIGAFQEVLGTWDDKRVKFLNAQDSEDEFADGLLLLEELNRYAETFMREAVSMDRLIVGLKCGGSDGLSGITANPLVGRISDLLAQYNAATVLTEVPEIFGSETMLMSRCQTSELFEQVVALINDFKRYYIRHGQEIYENPSPGNKEGGITTLEDKALGCTQKGGTSPVRAVLHNGERVMEKGLNLLDGPGNDMVAVTELTAAGAHMILFTTGRGTPLGAPVPTVKISTNTPLSKSKPAWIDFDAGRLIEGCGMDELSGELLSLIVDIASGKKQTRNEINHYKEIVIFKNGVTL